MSELVIPASLGFKPTEEQIETVKAAIENDCLKIDALAGSSKTTTLVLTAHNIPVKSLYLAFNKNMSEEAKVKFPAHVEVRTSHSLAYREVGFEYQHKLSRPRGEYKNVLGTGSEIARYFRLAPMMVGVDKTITSAALGHAIKSTVSNFEYSADVTLSDVHVSYAEVHQHLRNQSFKKKEYQTRVLKWAKELWKKRIDISDDTLITHDTYMKLFQLSDPDLSDYEVIYLDEAQDTNPCLLDIFVRQKSKLIAVGDNLQSIYGFRKAVNALDSLNWKHCKLTKSFRFGNDVADIANGVALDEDMRQFIAMRGNEKKHTEVMEDIPSNITSNICYIYRTNAAMLEKALQLIEAGKKVAIHVDVSDFVSKVESVQALKNNEIKKVKHQDIIIYSNWTELVSEVEHVGGELARIVKMVSKGEHERVLHLLRNYKPVNDPDVMLITAHKSKGLEFEIVVLGDDFETLATNEQTNKVEFKNLQERNLLYVACTRAIEILVINDIVKEILDINNLWGDNSYVEVCNGLELENVKILAISPEFQREGLEACNKMILGSKWAAVAQEQLDLHCDTGVFDEEDCDLSRNVNGSTRLMPELNVGNMSIRKYEIGSCVDLEKEVRLQTNAFGFDSGSEIGSLVEFVVDLGVEDGDDEDWRDMPMEPTGQFGA